jgi:hypothetical protein
MTDYECCTGPGSVANVGINSGKGISMKIASRAVIAALGFSLAGCATMVTGGSEDIAVLTPPVSGATCVLSNAAGSWTVVTPTVAHVERSNADMQVKCSNPGYQNAVATLPSQLEGLTLGNAATLGLGFGVDAYTGAINEYPHSIQIPMQPAAVQAPEADPSPPNPAPSN